MPNGDDIMFQLCAHFSQAVDDRSRFRLTPAMRYVTASTAPPAHRAQRSERTVRSAFEATERKDAGKHLSATNAPTSRLGMNTTPSPSRSGRLIGSASRQSGNRRTTRPQAPRS